MTLFIVLQSRNKYRLTMNSKFSPLPTHLHLQSQRGTCNKHNLRELASLGNAFNGQVSKGKGTILAVHNSPHSSRRHCQTPPHNDSNMNVLQNLGNAAVRCESTVGHLYNIPPRSNHPPRRR